MKNILTKIFLLLLKCCKYILYIIITMFIIVFAIFIIAFFGFNTLLGLLNKLMNKLL